MIANAFDVKTRNGSSVTPKIAGIESTAKMMSVVSTTTSTARSGVAIRTPSFDDEELLTFVGRRDLEERA